MFILNRKLAQVAMIGVLGAGSDLASWGADAQKTLVCPKATKVKKELNNHFKGQINKKDIESAKFKIENDKGEAFYLIKVRNNDPVNEYSFPLLADTAEGNFQLSLMNEKDRSASLTASKSHQRIMDEAKIQVCAYTQFHNNLEIFETFYLIREEDYNLHGHDNTYWGYLDHYAIKPVRSAIDKMLAE